MSWAMGDEAVKVQMFRFVDVLPMLKDHNAIARHLGVDLDNDDWQAVGHKTPLLVNLQPAGEYLAEDYHRAGGVPQVLKILLANGVLHGECMTIHGKTMAEMLKDIPAEPRKDQDVIRPWSNPIYKQIFTHHNKEQVRLINSNNLRNIRTTFYD